MARGRLVDSPRGAFVCAASPLRSAAKVRGLSSLVGLSFPGKSDANGANVVLLVGGDWLPFWIIVPRNIGFMSSSQLTFTPSFFRGVAKNHQPGFVLVLKL